MNLKIIIAGGRDYTLQTHHYQFLDQLLPLVAEVVSGACPTGVDHAGEAWARSHNITVKTFPADWKVLGRAAGPIRNQAMAVYADAVVLFPGGAGTESMAKIAGLKGLRIWDLRQGIEKHSLNGDDSRHVTNWKPE